MNIELRERPLSPPSWKPRSQNKLFVWHAGRTVPLVKRRRKNRVIGHTAPEEPCHWSNGAEKTVPLVRRRLKNRAIGQTAPEEPCHWADGAGRTVPLVRRLVAGLSP
jgi:hypothetical protein